MTAPESSGSGDECMSGMHSTVGLAVKHHVAR